MLETLIHYNWIFIYSNDDKLYLIYLPNGEKCYIVVLIKDSRESDDDNAKIMADISNIVYRHLNK